MVKKRQLLRFLPDENRRDVNLHRGHKITVATGLLQNNACGHDLVVFYVLIPCVHSLFTFYVYKKWK